MRNPATSCFSRSAIRRRIAIAGAALILFAQFLGAIHEHRLALSAAAHASALSADSGPCALCLFAFHSNFNPAPGYSLERPEPALAPIAAESRIGFDSFNRRSFLSRAPPRSA